MRLSEAIRLGAMLHRQAIGSLVRIENGEKKVCALGGAYLAAGLMGAEATQLPRDKSLPWAPYPFPAAWLFLKQVRCPDCGLQDIGSAAVLDTVTHLNDAHRWTREQIADWVQSLEPADAEPVGVAAVLLSVEEPVVTTRV